jgi:hypothetical protein
MTTRSTPNLGCRFDRRCFLISIFFFAIYSQVQIQKSLNEWYDAFSLSADLLIAPYYVANSSIADSVASQTTFRNPGPSIVPVKSPLKFYIIAPPRVTSKLLQDHPDKASSVYQRALNEESAEIWLHRGFERLTYEEGHTLNSSEADVFLICGYLHLNKAIHKPKGRGTKNDLSFVQEYVQLVSNKTKPHLMLIPSWNPQISKDAGIKDLTSTLAQQGVNIWSVGFERNKFWQWVEPQRILPIPYVIRPFQSKNILIENARNPRTRNFIFYAGDTRGNAKAWAGCHRDKIIIPLQNETDIMDVRLVGKTNRLNQSDYNHRMSSSEYCLILCGDTPSSRSLTSAMVSGCIPIRVGSRLRGLCEPPCHEGFGWRTAGVENSHLPFSQEIDWDVFPEVEESQVILHGKQTLQALLSRTDDTRKNKLRSKMLQVQMAWIYGWGDPINSTEFGEAVPYIWNSFVKTPNLLNPLRVD